MLSSLGRAGMPCREPGCTDSSLQGAGCRRVPGVQIRLSPGVQETASCHGLPTPRQGLLGTATLSAQETGQPRTASLLPMDGPGASTSHTGATDLGLPVLAGEGRTRGQ